MNIHLRKFSNNYYLSKRQIIAIHKILERMNLGFTSNIKCKNAEEVNTP